MNKKIKIAISFVLVFLCLCLVLTLLTRLLIPKSTDPRERGLTAEYYDEINEGNTHKVLFVGDCEVYESFTPPTLYKEYGITSYIRGNAQQLIWHSYYMLEEAFKYESPEVVVFNVLSMKYGEPQKEEYNRMTLDGMKNSSYKYKAIKASMTEDESLLSYYFPLLRYHSRWKDITSGDFKYMFNEEKVSHNGYLMMTGIKPKGEDREPELLLDYTLPEICFEYLDKMSKLCSDNDAELILIKAPTNSWKYYWYDKWDEQIVEYSNKNDIAYYNFIDNEDIGIDWSRDTYDAGLHLNVYGAEKLTSYFGKILSEKHNVTPSNDENEKNVWDEKYEYYIECKKELENNN